MGSSVKTSFLVHPGGDSREQRPQSHPCYAVGQDIKKEYEKMNIFNSQQPPRIKKGVGLMFREEKDKMHHFLKNKNDDTSGKCFSSKDKNT